MNANNDVNVNNVNANNNLNVNNDVNVNNDINDLLKTTLHLNYFKEDIFNKNKYNLDIDNNDIKSVKDNLKDDNINLYSFMINNNKCDHYFDRFNQSLY